MLVAAFNAFETVLDSTAAAFNAMNVGAINGHDMPPTEYKSGYNLC